MSLTVTITRRAKFSAAHRYARPEWSDERNRAVFGDNVKLHGHNYVLEATVRGRVDAETGMAADIGAIDGALRAVASKLDYRDVTEGVAGLEGKVPTTENLALFAWRGLGELLPATELVRVRLFESPDLYVEVSSDRSEA